MSAAVLCCSWALCAAEPPPGQHHAANLQPREARTAHASGGAAVQNSIMPEPMHGPAVAWWRLSTWWRLSHLLQQDSSGGDALLPAGCVCLALQPSCHGVRLHVSWLRQLLARPSNLLRLAAHRLHISQLEHRLLWLGGPMELLLCHSRRHLRWTHFAVPARAVEALVTGQQMPSKAAQGYRGFIERCCNRWQQTADMSPGHSAHLRNCMGQPACRPQWIWSRTSPPLPSRCDTVCHRHTL